MFDSGWLWRRPEFDFEYLNRVSVLPPSDDSNSDFEPAAPAAMRYTGSWYDIDAITTYVTNKFPLFSARERFIELVLPEPKEEIKEPEFVLKTREPEQKSKEIRYGARERCRLDLFYKGFVPYQADFSGGFAGRAGTTYFPEEKESFVKLVEQFLSEGIPVIFLMAPEYLPGRDAPQFDELTDEITVFAAQKGIPFLNYNRELISDINTDYTLYSDWGHLNERGAHLFSKKLYEDLKPILGYD